MSYVRSNINLNNTITIIGNLGKDPEMKYLSNGTAVAAFSVAETQYDHSAKEEVTVWWRVSVFGRLAERVNQYCRKGQQVAVFINRIGVSVNTERPDESGISWEAVADNVKFLGGARGNGNREQQPQHDLSTEDIPF